MKNCLFKGIIVAVLLASTAAVQASLSFSGSIAFNPYLTMTAPSGATLSTVTQVTANNPMAFKSSEVTGKYKDDGVWPMAANFLGNAPGGVFNLNGTQAFKVWSFNWIVSGTTYTYSLMSDAFTIYTQNDYFLNIHGTGTAYITETLTGIIAYESPATWSLTGTSSTGGGIVSWGLTTDVTPVPEPTTVIAGALLLLPFGVSTLRIWRQKRNA